MYIINLEYKDGDDYLNIRKLITVFLVCILFIGGICYYGVYISYNKLTENNYTIESKKIDKDINLIIISDLHDNELGENNINLVEKIKSKSPDMVLVVGDMVNDNSYNSNIVVDFLKQISLTIPVYYSLGNTEEDYIKANTSDLIQELKDINVTVLNNEYKDVKINNITIRIGGMYDYAFGVENKKVYNFLCDFQDTKNYKIMMAHRPDSFIFGDASEVWDIDLVVSGHTHGGQVRLPFMGGLYVGDQGYFPMYDKGLFDLNKIKILISSGLGSGKQKIPRFNNVPEVVNLKITNK